MYTHNQATALVVVLIIALCGTAMVLANTASALAVTNEKLQQVYGDLMTTKDSLHVLEKGLANDAGTIAELRQENAQLRELIQRDSRDLEIIADLRMHPDLIPFAGVLGGTFGFYFPDMIYVVFSRPYLGHVLAYVDDGHISGMVLLDFILDDNGEIAWRLAVANPGHEYGWTLYP
ncbi:MAG: hypothetical protein FWE76_03630 [Symbiobacteriaceae bacterium]|nr:hypothetical protein [Symbiobacteriaceae bacterium]